MATKIIIANGAKHGVNPTVLLERWHTEHAALVGEHLAPSRYAITTVDKPKRGYHGIAIAHLSDGQQDVLANLPQAIRADPFYDMIGARTAMTLSEHVIVDGETTAAGFKIAAFVCRRADVQPEEFFEHWLQIHAPNVAGYLGRTEGALRYVVNHFVDAPQDAPFHGVAELWYTDEAASKAHLGAVPSDGFEELSSDILFLKGRERIMIGAGA